MSSAVHRTLRVCLIGILALGLSGCLVATDRFSGERAMRHVEAQCDLGPRPVDSEANRLAADYIVETLTDYGWEVEEQAFAFREKALRNVIGKKGEGPLIILGTHFDTRPVADRDPANRSAPVLGANDGASGTAVLLELARVLGEEATDRAEIWLAFFDGEDSGELNAWPWCVGSLEMANGLTRRPEYVLVVDMIGDADQQIYYEWTSSLWLQEKVWAIAADLGYEKWFIPEHRYSILDDHTSFLQRGMSAAVIIDFDYPYWHTTHDTVDKVSADSLQRVGDVLQRLLEEEPFAETPDAR
ncbi:MAG: M28 family peptidase [Chloroflexi bacterium]|nr:M28 family peptidase [Chloroflexota bacterium]